jgi:tetratricopeptide (TPR) repeat protein
MQVTPVPAIAAALIVTDAARRLPACLEALLPAVDEIVVLDTGSTDGTGAVARGFTPHVYDFAWCDDFAAARNAALERVSADWVLVVDADEVLQEPEAARAALQRFAAEHADHVLGLVAMHSPTGPEADAPVAVDRLPRFFRHGCYRFQGAIHEQLVPVAGGRAAADTGVRFLHTGYAQAHDDPAHKSHRNRRLLVAALEKDPEDEYLWHQLGKAHYALKEYAEAVDALGRAFGLMDFSDPDQPRGRTGTVARDILAGLAVLPAYALVNLGRVEDALAHLERHAALGHPGTRRADFPHVLGYVHLMRGDVDRSRAAYLDSLLLGPASEDVLGTGSFASHYHLGLLGEARGDLAEACAHYAEAVRIAPDYRPALARVADLVAEQGIAVPEIVWAHCDRAVFEAVYVEKLRAQLGAGNVDAVKRLIAAAGTLSSGLVEACKRVLQASVG